VDYEPVFFFTKSKQYWFEPQYEPHQEVSLKRAEYGWHKGKEYPPEVNAPQGTERLGEWFVNPRGRNKRCVWTIPTQPFADAHFAVYPEELCEIPIKAGCPEFICTRCGEAREKIIEVEINSMRFNRGEKSNKFGVKQDVDYERIDRGYTDCGCNAGWHPGVVLDPFFGTGTTAIVAHQLHRSWVGIELSEEYILMAKRRLVEHGVSPTPASAIVSSGEV
jgi:site-specific DNA-methyltransferase (adenine-specific)